MIRELEAALAPDDYSDLPECIKASYSVKEWLWLSDGEKARLLQTETEPDTFSD